MRLYESPLVVSVANVRDERYETQSGDAIWACDLAFAAGWESATRGERLIVPPFFIVRGLRRDWESGYHHCNRIGG